MGFSHAHADPQPLLEEIGLDQLNVDDGELRGLKLRHEERAAGERDGEKQSGTERMRGILPSIKAVRTCR